jgi:hypothetical protein
MCDSQLVQGWDGGCAGSALPGVTAECPMGDPIEYTPQRCEPPRPLARLCRKLVDATYRLIETKGLEDVNASHKDHAERSGARM